MTLSPTRVSAAWFPRIPEPEDMDDADEVAAYDEADFGEVNRALAARIVALAGERGRAVDLGTGPASIALEVARLAPRWRIAGVDSSPRMLARGRRRLRAAGLEARVRLVRGSALGPPLGGRFDLVFSNSLLHHLGDPIGFWVAVARLAAPGGAIAVQDLARPPSRAAADRLTALHAADASPLLRELFHRSLLAAYTPAEIAMQLRLAGLRGLDVAMVSDRHVLVSGRA